MPLQSPAFIMRHRFCQVNLAGLLGDAVCQRRAVVDELITLAKSPLHKPPLADLNVRLKWKAKGGTRRDTSRFGPTFDSRAPANSIPVVRSLGPKLRM
jgi:hypothetical protein